MQLDQIVKSYDAETGALEFFGPILGGVEAVTVTLTDAQIRAMPTTSPIILPAPGAGKMYLGLTAVERLNTLAGAYTGVDAAGTARLVYGASVTNFCSVSGLLQTGIMDAALDIIAMSAPKGMDFISSFPIAGIANLPILLVGTNNGSGDFTGGNVANFYRVTIVFQIVTL